MPHAELTVDRHEFRCAGHSISVLIAGGDAVDVQSPGTGALPPVLAVHGFGSSAESSWQRTGHLTALVRAGRRVIAPDLLGHGHSDKPIDPAAYSLAGLVELALAAVCEVTGGEATGGVATGGVATGGAAGRPAVDLLGYSLGARICWEILTAAVPGRPVPRRAVLGGFDGRALFDGVDESALIAVLREPERADEPSSEAVESVAVQSLPPATRRIVDIIRAGRDVRREALLAVVRGLSGSPVGTGTSGIPVLFAAGERDPLATGAEQWAARLPAGEFLSIPRRDHISAVPAGVFRSAVVQFLGP